MRRGPIAFLLATLSLGACRGYDFYHPVADQDGLLPAQQFARYGREQAIVMAIGRKYASARGQPAGAQAKVAADYARSFPDVLGVEADTIGNRLTVQFRSAWRVGIVPIADGESAEGTKIPK